MNKDCEFSRIAAVIVTYNSERSIESLIRALLVQTRPIENIITVDNASSDGTIHIVREKFPQVTLLKNTSNLGVGGGYAQGIEWAYKNGHKWIWLLDSDSLPQTSALEELVKTFYTFKSVYPPIGILASSPVNVLTKKRYDGFLWRGRFVKLPTKLKQCETPFPVDSTISSGCLVNREIIENVGLPRTEFFMDFVDHEYNLRVRAKGYVILFVPSSVIYHEIGKTRVVRTHIAKTIARLVGSPLSIQVPWRMYYMVRNELYTLWHEFPSCKALCFFVLRLGGMLLGILFWNDDKKLQRIKYIMMGIKDGFRGNLERRVTQCDLPPEK